jgi:predicted PurR-regulated permease PerM
MTTSNKIAAPFSTRLAMILVSILALGYIIIIGEKILAPLLFSFLCAIVLLPLANFFELRLKLPRGGAALFSVLTFFIFLICILYIVGSQITGLTHDWPLFKDQFDASLNDLQNWIALHFHVDIQKQKNYINNTTSKVLSSGTSIIGTTILSLSSILFFLALVSIDTFFLLFYRSLLLKFLVAVFPKNSSSLVFDVVQNIQFIIRRYIIGLLVEMSIVAALCCTAFLIAGVKYAILLGLITALFNIIPYAGIFTSLVLSTFITFAVAGTSAKVLVVIITIIAVHLIDSNILLPFIVGSKIRINGMITVLAVIIGEMVWGIDGMFLAVPVIAVTKIIFDRIEPLKPWGILLGHEKGEKDVRTVSG